MQNTLYSVNYQTPYRFMYKQSELMTQEDGSSKQKMIENITIIYHRKCDEFMKGVYSNDMEKKNKSNWRTHTFRYK